MSEFRYRMVVEWSDEDRAFVARVPALPGCMAHGSTSARAVKEAQEAAEAILTVMKDRGHALPEEDVAADYSGQIRLRMPRSLHERLARLSSAEGVSLNQLMLAMLSGEAGVTPAQRRPPRIAKRAGRRSRRAAAG
jgi:predicted RNase H-like HicB family nuclease